MQIVFASEHNCIGWLIKIFTKISWVKRCRVVHVIVRYGEKESAWIIEANEKGFNPGWWNYFLKKEKIFVQYEVLGIDEELLEKIIDEQVDKFVHDGYDFGGVLGLALSVLWYKITGKRIKNIFSWSKHFFCSEIVYKIFNEVKKQTSIDYFGNHDAGSVFPEELLNECENRPSLFKKLLSLQ